MGFDFPEHIFIWFPTGLLGVLCVTIAIVHIYKYYCKHESLLGMLGNKRQAYLVRSLNWLVFGVALFLFPHLGLLQARATLRVALAFMILSELGYNLTYLIDMIREIPNAPSLIRQKIGKITQWTHRLLQL